MSELQNFRDKEANLDLAKKLNLLVWIISAAVLGLVVMMQKIKIKIPLTMPCSIRWQQRGIKKGKVILHQKMIYAAFSLPVPCLAQSARLLPIRMDFFRSRPYYLFILISHIGNPGD